MKRFVKKNRLVKGLQNSLRIVISIALISGLLYQPILLAQDDEAEKAKNLKVKKSLGKFFISFGKFSYNTISSELNKDPNRPPISVYDTKANLQKIANGYQTSIENNTGAIKMLDAALEVPIVGAEVTYAVPSAGLALLLTSGVRYAKDAGINYLIQDVTKKSQSLLAKDLLNQIGKDGLTYESFLAKPDAEKIKTLDKLDSYVSVKNSLGSDEKAKEIFRDSTISILKDTQKATLVEVAQNTEDIGKLKKDVAAVSKTFAKYQKQTDEALTNINTQLSLAEKAIEKAGSAIKDLNEKTALNTTQLKAVSDILYSKASNQERLILLKGGYLKPPNSPLDPGQYEDLLSTVDSKARTEAIVNRMSAIVGDINKVGAIAANLGLDVPKEVTDAINYANVANDTINAVVSGNYLGAVMGLTGFFGKKSDPAMERHKEMMNFMAKQFEQVNKKLDQLIEGQQKLMEAVAGISEQIMDLQQKMNERFDVVEIKLDTIQDMVYEILYADLINCSANKGQIEGDGTIETDFTSFGKMKPQRQKDAGPCMNYLNKLFYTALDPDKLGIEPLALRYGKTFQEVSISNDTKSKYDNNRKKIDDYIKEKYLPSQQFLLSQAGQIHGTKGITLASLLSSLSIPSRNIKNLNTKLNNLSQFSRSCVNNSPINDSLLGLLCKSDSNKRPNRFNLDSTSPEAVETKATERVTNLLASPIMHDKVLTLSEWALFYAPIADSYDFANSKLFLTNDKIDIFKIAENKANYEVADGEELLKGALRVINVSLAQMNVVYGDLTAKAIFQQLWDKDNKRFWAEDKLISKEQKDALNLFKNGNNYLRQNVLVIALNETSEIGASGQKEAYSHAIEWMKTATVLPDGSLRATFGNNWAFENIGKPVLYQKTTKDGKPYYDVTPEQIKECSDAAKIPGQKPNCEKFPVVALYGQQILLPEVDIFVEREFVYPEVMLRTMKARTQLVSKIAEYEAVEWAVKNSGEDFGTTFEKYVDTLIQIAK